jgi:hypothetical protein
MLLGFQMTKRAQMSAPQAFPIKRKISRIPREQQSDGFEAKGTEPQIQFDVRTN